jgi:D-alanyl-D-alanine carboxypeptidase/D-alanyl-D-alanine-endopeptidase (penicillin-binding protein 4)
MRVKKRPGRTTRHIKCLLCEFVQTAQKYKRKGSQPLIYVMQDVQKQRQPKSWLTTNRAFLGLSGMLIGVLVSAQTLPEAVSSALSRAKIPLDSVSILIADTAANTPPRLSHRGDTPMNPASVMKLVTTYAALDVLGPAFTWRTPVWLDGTVREGSLKGNLVIQGQGDPKLVQERLLHLLQRVQAMGVRHIDGDIVLDQSFFAPIDLSPADFDGDPLRPYNVQPEALSFNFKSVTLTLTPDLAAKVARVHYSVPLWGVEATDSVALSTEGNADCGDYRQKLAANFSDPSRLQLSGSYPAACGEKSWSLAYVDPSSYNARNLQALWRSLGGKLSGRVRDGKAPASAPTFQLQSPALAEVVRDINKFSNNLMAQQLFLTLALPVVDTAKGELPGTVTPATREMARALVQRWWQQRVGESYPLTIDNGSGLSRQARLSVQGLAQMLQLAYASPNMPDLMASLPIVGIDGTLRRSRATPASAHLKTGSLRDVMALAGYVHLPDGKRLCLVAIINHANAPSGRPALDALLQWALSGTRQ